MASDWWKKKIKLLVTKVGSLEESTTVHSWLWINLVNVGLLPDPGNPLLGPRTHALVQFKSSDRYRNWCHVSLSILLRQTLFFFFKRKEHSPVQFNFTRRPNHTSHPPREKVSDPRGKVSSLFVSSSDCAMAGFCSVSSSSSSVFSPYTCLLQDTPPFFPH